eukprot:951698_1
MNYKTVGILVLAVCLVSSASGAKLNNHRSIGEKKNRISRHVEEMKDEKDSECKGEAKCISIEELQTKQDGDYVCGDKSLYEYLTVDKIGDETFPSGICATKVANTFAAGGPDVFFDIGCACKNQRLRSIHLHTPIRPFPGAAFVSCGGAWNTIAFGSSSVNFFCSTAN